MTSSDRLSKVPRIAIPVPTSSDFQYNRRSWPMYAEAVRRAGGRPIEMGLSLCGADLRAVAKSCDGVLLPGSPADVDPMTYGHEAEPTCAPADLPREAADRILLEDAYASGKPVLAICFGVQFLNVWRGGTLIQDLGGRSVNHSAGSSVAVAHSVSIEAGGILDLLSDPSEMVVKIGKPRLPVNSSHHQSVDRVGDGLMVAAVSSEDGVIEAIEGAYGVDHPEFVVGIQWHPERTTELSATSRAIFKAFIDAVIAWRQTPQVSRRVEHANSLPE